MVIKENAAYLLTSLDSQPKDSSLKSIRSEFLAHDLQDFDFDRLYARDLALEKLQERLLALPVKAKKRVIEVKNAEALKSDIKKYILEYIKEPLGHVVLVLDMDKPDSRDDFVSGLTRYAGKSLPREERLDTFTLIDQIGSRKAGGALSVLRKLFDKGERPERILGGLRHAFENRASGGGSGRERLKALLNCDIDIKTGRLKPEFALEKLVVDLCCLKDS